jgi:hypothetical protein
LVWFALPSAGTTILVVTDIANASDQLHCPEQRMRGRSF